MLMKHSLPGMPTFLTWTNLSLSKVERLKMKQLDCVNFLPPEQHCPVLHTYKLEKVKTSIREAER